MEKSAYPSIVMLRRSFLVMEEQIRRHLPWDPLPLWVSQVRHRSGTFIGGYLEYSLAILALQSSLHHPQCTTSPWFTHVWHGGFDVDEEGRVTWSCNPELPVDTIVLRRDGMSLREFQSHWKIWSPGRSDHDKSLAALRLWFPRSSHTWEPMRLKDPTGFEFSRRVHYVYPSTRPLSTSPPFETRAPHQTFVGNDARLTLTDVETWRPVTADLLIDLRRSTCEDPRAWDLLAERLNDSGRPVHAFSFRRRGQQDRLVRVRTCRADPLTAIRRLELLVDRFTSGEAERVMLKLKAVAEATNRAFKVEGGPTADACANTTDLALPFNITITIPIDQVVLPDDNPVQRMRPRKVPSVLRKKK